MNINNTNNSIDKTLKNLINTAKDILSKQTTSYNTSSLNITSLPKYYNVGNTERGENEKIIVGGATDDNKIPEIENMKNLPRSENIWINLVRYTILQIYKIEMNKLENLKETGTNKKEISKEVETNKILEKYVTEANNIIEKALVKTSKTIQERIKKNTNITKNIPIKEFESFVNENYHEIVPLIITSINELLPPIIEFL